MFGLFSSDRTTSKLFPFNTPKALFAVFFLSGFLYAAWIVRTPDIRNGLGLTLGQMGWVLFGLSAGAMLGLLVTAKLVNRYGPRLIILAGALIIHFGLLLSALPLVIALPIPGSIVAGLGLGCVGLGSIFLDIAVNVAGAAWEATQKRPFLTTLHGCFSFGEAIGAFFGFACVLLGFAPMQHFLLACALMLTLVFLSAKPLSGADSLVTQTARLAATPQNQNTNKPRMDGLLMTAILVVFAVALCEGTANDWLPILLGETLNATSSFSAFAFALFATGLAIIRFTGTYWLNRFGRQRVLAGSGALALCGLLLVIFIQMPLIVILGVILWSAGTALGYPVALSAGAATGSDTATRMSMLSTAGYGAFLVGPPCLGFIADHLGLPFALGFAAMFLFLPIFFAKKLSTKTS